MRETGSGNRCWGCCLEVGAGRRDRACTYLSLQASSPLRPSPLIYLVRTPVHPLHPPYLSGENSSPPSRAHVCSNSPRKEVALLCTLGAHTSPVSSDGVPIAWHIVTCFCVCLFLVTLTPLYSRTPGAQPVSGSLPASQGPAQCLLCVLRFDSPGGGGESRAVLCGCGRARAGLGQGQAGARDGQRRSQGGQAGTWREGP